jgi:hypothetical protein
MVRLSATFVHRTLIPPAFLKLHRAPIGLARHHTDVFIRARGSVARSRWSHPIRRSAGVLEAHGAASCVPSPGFYARPFRIGETGADAGRLAQFATNANSSWQMLSRIAAEPPGKRLGPGFQKANRKSARSSSGICSGKSSGSRSESKRINRQRSRCLQADYEISQVQRAFYALKNGQLTSNL